MATETPLQLDTQVHSYKQALYEVVRYSMLIVGQLVEDKTEHCIHVRFPTSVLLY